MKRKRWLIERCEHGYDRKWCSRCSPLPRAQPKRAGAELRPGQYISPGGNIVTGRTPPGTRTASTGNAHMICPHCQTKGSVSTERVRMKQGISGAKATGAVLTSGVSVLFPGLSRRQWVTEARCRTCKCEWMF
jgi:hypothetical protein